VDEQGNEVLEACAGEALQRLLHIALDGFAAEDAAELVAERLDAALEMALGDRIRSALPCGSSFCSAASLLH
jgi:hypothetical protein